MLCVRKQKLLQHRGGAGCDVLCLWKGETIAKLENQVRAHRILMRAPHAGTEAGATFIVLSARANHRHVREGVAVLRGVL